MHRYKLLMSFLLILSFFSCKKVAEIRETDFIDESKAFATIENAEQGVIGAYAGFIPEGNMYITSILSDEVKNAEFPSQDATVHSWIFGPDDIVLTRNEPNLYANHYKAIDRANRILRALPDADSTKAGDNSLRNRLRGEMLALRAYLHFELWRWYAGNYNADGLALPYMEEPSIKDQGRIKMGTYFEKMKADLAEARNLIPSSIADIYRLTRTAVISMQARVALYMKDWANAETFATEVITAVPLAARDTFPNIWSDASIKEVIWKMKRINTSTNPPGSWYRGKSSSTTNVGLILYGVSSKLWDSYDQANDIRFTSYVKNEPLLTGIRAPFSKIVKKYEGTGYGTAGENVNDFKVFRTGEMYMIRSEARAEQNKLSAAAQDLNDLRKARILGYADQTFADKNTLISAIIDERFKELAFEGHRYWDLKRRSQPVDRRAVDAPNAISITLPADNFRFVIPIPFYEMLANRAMEQNPGY